MARLLLAFLLAVSVAGCWLDGPGLVRTQQNGMTCWWFGDTGYVSCRDDAEPVCSTPSPEGFEMCVGAQEERP